MAIIHTMAASLFYYYLTIFTHVLCEEKNFEEYSSNLNEVFIFEFISWVFYFHFFFKEDRPQILTGNLNITAYIGDTVTLPCEVFNLGNNHVNWLKIKNDTPNTLTVGYQQFSRNLRYRVARFHEQSHKLKTESWNFEIRKLEPDDQGIYECYIRSSSKHKIKVNIRLTVKNEKGTLI